MATAKTTTKKSKSVHTPTDTTDRNHLISIIQEHTGSSKTNAKQALDAVIDSIGASLKKNKKVQLLGFGSFDVVKRAARMGHNPSTGEPMKIKASKTVRFRPGKALKDRV